MSRWVGRLSAVVLLAVLVAWGVALLGGYDVVADVDNARISARPGTAGLLLGADRLGRSVGWRLVEASRAFVLPGLAAAFVAGVLGVGAGALAGYRGGAIDVLLRQAWRSLAAVPRFVLVLLACTIYGAEPAVLAVSCGVAYAPVIAEAVASRIAALHQHGFVLASRAHGVSAARTLVVHLLWANCRALVARHLLHVLAFVVVVETSLSYLGGFGIEEPQPSWGNMLALELGTPDGNPAAVLGPALCLWAVVAATLGAASRLREAGRA
ncbi:MAG: ABC transporter permease [Alphaproteobacteria bacterium]|nr:ABC transporter permease [Alphaproteobacteria bacterium]